MIPRERLSMLTSQPEVRVCSHSPEANPTSTAGGHWSLAGLTSPESPLLHLKAIITDVTSGSPGPGQCSERRELAGSSPEAVQAWHGQGERGVNRDSIRAERTPRHGPTQQSMTTLNVGTLYSPQEVGEAILHSRENSNPLPSRRSGRIG